MIEPFKYLIQAVAIERDETGRVTREIPADVLAVYSIEQAVEAITQFERGLIEGGNGADPDLRTT